MKRNKKYPKVLLVGRTNAGKSTLFNRITGKKKSIVFDQDGVTRDYMQERVTWDDKTFNLIDTGGLSFKRTTSEIEKKIQEKVLKLLESASAILFVCDVKSGITQNDMLIAKTLHKVKKPVFLLLNKADNSTAVEDNLHEFYKLGFDDMTQVSALHGFGVGPTLDKVTDLLPEEADLEFELPQYHISIIGKPNVGKSSLMNLLVHEQRSIVSPVAGTTRETVSENVYFCSELMQITDTAGVRRKSRINEDLETLMAKSSLRSIKEADIVLLMIDASAGKICDQELKLLFYAREMKKPVLILYNKVDLIKDDDYTKMLLEQSMDRYNFVLKKTTQIAISCLSKKNVCKVLGEVQKVIARCSQEIDSAHVDEILKGELEKKRMYHKRQLLRVHKIRNIKAAVPTFVLTVNYPQWFGPTQLGFIENVIRKHYDLRGCPIQLDVKGKK